MSIPADDMDILAPANRADLAQLKQAYKLLNTPSLTAKLADAIGSPIEWGVQQLPAGAREKIDDAVRAALHKAVDAAIWTMDDRPHKPASARLHAWGAAASGAVGGFFGFSSLLLELPLSITIMMRAVADIARAEGFQLSDFNVQLDCIQVFALDGRTAMDGQAGESGTDTGLLVTRGALHNFVNLTAAELAAIAAERAGKEAAAHQAAAILAKVIDAVAKRFGVVVTEKMAAQIVPVLGAVAGAGINALFTRHYQDIARGYFMRKRLAGKYGAAAIMQAWQTLHEVQHAGTA